MKKLLLLLTLLPLLLFTSCKSAGIPSAETKINYINTPMYCQIDGNVDHEFGETLRFCSSAFPEGNSLCIDPLCWHDKDICAEFIKTHGVVTNGKKLYIHSNSYNIDVDGKLRESHRKEGNSFMRLDAVYQLDFKTGGLKRLAEYPAANELITITSEE